MYYTMDCGCQLDVLVYTPWGCCCGECYSYDTTEVTEAYFVSNCIQHSEVAE